MSKVLMILVALAAVFFVGLFVAIPPPFGWVRDAGNVVLAALAGVQWTMQRSRSVGPYKPCAAPQSLAFVLSDRCRCALPGN